MQGSLLFELKATILSASFHKQITKTFTLERILFNEYNHDYITSQACKAHFLKICVQQHTSGFTMKSGRGLKLFQYFLGI